MLFHDHFYNHKIDLLDHKARRCGAPSCESMQSTPEQQRVRVCRQLDIKRKIDNFRNISTVVSLCRLRLAKP